ncbi:MAG: DUF4272 domain-containing protein [Phycisphaerales bacterium]|nr:DUF4272 domain-containing protein [Phycisphaerales bacterium]
MWPWNRKSRPTAQDAARRLVILKHITIHTTTAPPRDMLAEIMANWDAVERAAFERDAEETRREMCGALKAEGLWAYLSPKEQALCATTIVTFSEQQQIDGTWRLEAAQTLMWALGLLPKLPPYDSLAEPEVLKPVPCQETAGFIAQARLRDAAEIDQARDLAEFWHWRCRTRELIERGEVLEPNEAMKSAGLNSFDDIIRMAAQRGAEDGSFASIDGDFPARGKAYRDLTADEWSEVGSITRERHFALNWLCGYASGNRWDKTPTDT